MPHLPSERLPELRAVMGWCCGHAQLLFHGETPWSSATFSGTRHTIALAFRGREAFDYGEALLELLPEAELNLPGKIMADISVVAVERVAQPHLETVVTLQLLMLDDK
jgi:hypothetical protein